MSELIKNLLSPFPQIELFHIMVLEDFHIMVTGFNRQGFDSHLWCLPEDQYKDADKSLLVSLEIKSSDIEHFAKKIQENARLIFPEETIKRIEAKDGGENYTFFPDGSFQCHKRDHTHPNNPINFAT